MTTVSVNRAPVLTLWAAVVAKRLGYTWDEALTLGRALAGLNAQSKGRRLGLFEPSKTGRRPAPEGKGKVITVELMERAIPAVRTEEGVRAISGKNPMDPKSVERYLEGKFGEALPEVRTALQELARSKSPTELAREAFGLYESFRPAVPRGARGWGAAGTLDLARVRALARLAAPTRVPPASRGQQRGVPLQPDPATPRARSGQLACPAGRCTHGTWRLY